MRSMIAAVVLIGACSKGSKAPASHDASTVAKAERWAASTVLGTRIQDFVVEFENGGARLRAGSVDAPLADVTYTDDRIAFTLEKAGAPKEAYEHFDLARTGDRAEGNDTIGADKLLTRMVKLHPDEPPRSAFLRPQTPQPPFAYRTRELEIAAPDGGKLSGTLVIPEGAAPFPVVVLLSGSGQQDRDETIYGHKPFLVIADALGRLGIATYRFDDRGTGSTTGALGSLDTEIADAKAAVAALKTQPEIDPGRIGLLGHSAAGMVVPSVAVDQPVKFAVLLAGCTRSGRDYSAFQTERAARAAGADEAALVIQRDLQARVSAAALQGKDAARDVLVEVIAPMLAQQLGREPTPEELDAAVAPQMSAVMEPWTLSYFRIDPRDAWKQLSIPVLLLVGGKDTQVPAQMTIDALKEAVKPALLTAETRDGLNHLFQHAQTGEVDEYLTIEETFDPATLALLTDWIARQTK